MSFTLTAVVNDYLRTTHHHDTDKPIHTLEISA